LSRVIAIAGAKGSPGCSFLAVALARRLADGQTSTLLVDADAEGGGTAAALDLGPAANADSVDAPPMQVDQNLWFAEIGQGRGEAFNCFQWLTDARTRHEAVIVDLGHSSRAMQRQLSAAADWLLWVVVPDRSGLQRADAALSSSELSAASVGLAFNRIGRGCLAGAEEALAGRHHLPVLARFADDRRVAERMALGLAVHRSRRVRGPLSDLARSVQLGAGKVVAPWQ
jgi:Flp pilus assembly CpaE family ATPase